MYDAILTLSSLRNPLPLRVLSILVGDRSGRPTTKWTLLQSPAVCDRRPLPCVIDASGFRVEGLCCWRVLVRKCLSFLHNNYSSA